MHGTISRALGMAVLIAGCASPASSSPTSPESSTSIEPSAAFAGTPVPSATAVAPTATATPSIPRSPSGLTIGWERGTLPAEMHETSFDELVHVNGTWVGATNCRPGDCGELGSGVVVWASSDGEHWSSGTNMTAASDGEFASRILAVGTTGFMLTTDPFTTPLEPTQLWLSADGRDWRAGALPDLGCTRTPCPDPRGLALAPTGTMLVSFVGRDEDERIDPLASDDGVHWRSIRPSAFGLEALFVESMESTDSAVMLVGKPCADCERRIWTSADGVTWDRVADLRLPPYSQAHLATGHGLRLITLTRCAPVCEGTEIWGAADDEPWTLRLSERDVSYALPAFTGSAFVAVGVGVGATEWRVLASADGATWRWWPLDSAMNGADEDCPPSLLAGGSGTLLLGGYLGCGFWQGTVSLP